MITILVVAFVGHEVQQMIQSAMNFHSNRNEMIRRIGRVRRVKMDGIAFDDDWLVKNMNV